MNLFRKIFSERAQKETILGVSFFYMEITDRIFYLIDSCADNGIHIMAYNCAVYKKCLSWREIYIGNGITRYSRNIFTVITDSLWVCLLSTTLSVIIGLS